MSLVKKYTFVLFIIFLTISESIGQSKKDVSEPDLLKQAETYFNDEDYEDAFSLFSQLLSLKPKNLNYRYKFGICVLYNSEDKSEAITYLLKVAEKKSDERKKVLYYLGMGYQFNYQFEEAKLRYNQYRKTLNPKKDEDEIKMVDRQIETCTNGEDLLKYMHNLKVYDKKKMDKRIFFRAYDLGNRPEDMVLAKPKEFMSSLDKKYEKNPVIYKSDTNQAIFFSSYNKDGINGKDLYKIFKLPNGQWSEPERLPDNINSKYDEDYPFFHADGKTLYFASKGHNSMGGYDIFKSTYYADINKWSDPENMDFPINSTSDDIFYMPDANQKFAYFSSNRNCSFSKMIVYKISVPEKPQPYTIIKGVLKLDDSSQYIQGKISAYSIKNNQLMGIYQTNVNPQHGKFILVLPPDRYRLVIEHPDYNTFDTVVEIPPQSKLIALNQTIRIGKRIRVTNSFENIEDNKFLENIDFINNRAKLEINVKLVEPIDTIDNSKNNKITKIKIVKPFTGDSLSKYKNDKGPVAITNTKKGTHIEDNSKSKVNETNESFLSQYDLGSIKILPVRFERDKTEITLNDQENITALANLALVMRIFPTLNIKVIGYFNKATTSSENVVLLKKRSQFIINHLSDKYLIKSNRFKVDIVDNQSEDKNKIYFEISK